MGRKGEGGRARKKLEVLNGGGGGAYELEEDFGVRSLRGTYLRVNDISKFLSLSFLVFYWFMQEN